MESKTSVSRVAPPTIPSVRVSIATTAGNPAIALAGMVADHDVHIGHLKQADAEPLHISKSLPEAPLSGS